MRRTILLGQGALAGTALGAGLVAAEVVAGYAAGGRFGPAWWVALLLYYVPFGALMGAAGGLLGGLAGAEPRGVGAATAGLLPPLAFLYVAVVAYHEFPAPRFTLRLSWALALGLATGAAVRRFGPTSAPRALLFPVPLALSCLLAARVRPGSGLAGAAVFVLVGAAASLGLLVLGRLGNLVSNPARKAGAGVASAALAGTLVAHGLRPPFDAVFRDLPQPQVTGPGGRPNIVLIVLDTVRAANLSCHGHPRSATPRLDAFARKAVCHTRCTTVSTWSLPAHASLFTGLYPPRHGADAPAAEAAQEALPLAERVTTLAEALAVRGYATCGVVANFGILGPVFGLDRGFRRYEALPSSRMLRLPYPPLLKRAERRLPEWLVARPLLRAFATPWRPAEEIVASARRWLTERRGAQPYFLFLNFMDAHSPYVPREGAGEPFPERAVREIAGGTRPATPAERERLAALYEGTIRHLDRQLGALFDLLQAQHDGDNTWIFVTSDHGEALGEHDALGHYCVLHQEVLGVPLIVRYPRSLPRDPAVDERPVQLVDVMPTILEGLGVTAPQGLDGVPIGSGRDAMLAEAVCSLPMNHLPDSRRGSGWALLEGDLKYVDGRQGPPRLFDLQSDPAELRDLARTRPEDVARLRERLDRWRAAFVAPPGAPASSGERRGRQEALKALGYLP